MNSVSPDEPFYCPTDTGRVLSESNTTRNIGDFPRKAAMQRAKRKPTFVEEKYGNSGF